MKELKYRVYDNAEKCYSDKAFSIDQLGICYAQDEDGYWEEIDEERYIVEQYTGLKDKNGKEIYEGDILEFDKDFDDTPQRYVPYFDEKLAAFGFKIYDYQDYISESGAEEFESEISLIGKTDNYEREEIIFYTEYISIVGNIHENADLLEGK